MDQEQAKNEILAFRQMKADRAEALRTGNTELLESWPALRRYQQALSKLSPSQRAPYTPADTITPDSPAVLALKAPLSVLAGQTG